MTTIEATDFSRDPGEFEISLVHLSVGWRYWAWERHTMRDSELGLDPDGYATEDEAKAAVMRACARGEQ